MTSHTPTQTKLLTDMAQFVLTHGLQNASLRPLAKAAGTSDRMLIYHFGSKEALLAAVMRFIADRMAEGLNVALAETGQMTAQALLGAVWEIAQTPEVRPAMRIWLELASMAARDGGAAQEIATDIADSFLHWTAEHLRDPDLAPLVLTHFEGMLVLQEAGREDIVKSGLAALASALGDR